MSKKKRAGGPVPPGNRPKGPPQSSDGGEAADYDTDGTGFNEQDPKRRLGDHTGAGEHAIQQPGGKNGANHTGASQ